MRVCTRRGFGKTCAASPSRGDVTPVCGKLPWGKRDPREASVELGRAVPPFQAQRSGDNAVCALTRGTPRVGNLETAFVKKTPSAHYPRYHDVKGKVSTKRAWRAGHLSLRNSLTRGPRTYVEIIYFQTDGL